MTQTTKECRRCSREHSLDMYYPNEGICKDCKRASNRQRQLKQMYGITEERYSEMLSAQNGMCGICGTTRNNNPRMKFFCVDHCHTTGEVRGLLCQECNFFLGKLERELPRLDKFLSYLNR